MPVAIGSYFRKTFNSRGFGLGNGTITDQKRGLGCYWW
jgi:hypothetical protein